MSSYYEPSGALVTGDTAVNKIIPRLCLPEVHVLVVLPGESREGPPPLHHGQLCITGLGGALLVSAGDSMYGDEQGSGPWAAGRVLF